MHSLKIRCSDYDEAAATGITHRGCGLGKYVVSELLWRTKGSALLLFPILVREFVQGHYRSFYGSMFFLYNSRAEELYLKGQPMEDTLKALYQAAQCLIITAELYLPEPSARLKAEHTGQYHHKTVVNYALLAYEYDTAASLMDEDTSPYIRLFYTILHADDRKSDILLPAGTQKANAQLPSGTSGTASLSSADTRKADIGSLLQACEQKADPIYRGADFRLASALCEGDPDKIRSCAVKMLRAIRAMESVYCEVFPIFLILALRCTSQMEIPIRKINVSELPDALIGKTSPFDRENSMPFGADKYYS